MNRNSHNGRSPLTCIVPDHILRHLAERGTARQKDWAMKTLITTARLRGHREVLQTFAESLLPAGEKRRTIYDAGHKEKLPGKLVRGEGSPATGDKAIDEAYDGAGATYDFYWNVYKRNSVDNKGMRLDSSVHYSEDYDNAFWNGKQMVYGDGDGEIFDRFTKSIDVIGHELTHGVTQFTARLEYSGQSGALNESYSDVFGSLVKQNHLKQTAAQADWLIGVGLFTPNVKGGALRSMKAPGTAYDDPQLGGKDPQPDHMSKYVKTSSDNGGVHLNSGIPNHAFYLVATQLGGNAWDKAGRIWYVTLTERLQPTSEFQDAATLTYKVAGELYGTGGAEQNAVASAWDKVGIKVS